MFFYFIEQKNNYNFAAICQKTEEDVTAFILTQIVMEKAKNA
jgi:polyhydroxyalkanoate synthesis regulator protein